MPGIRSEPEKSLAQRVIRFGAKRWKKQRNALDAASAHVEKLEVRAIDESSGAGPGSELLVFPVELEAFVESHGFRNLLSGV